MLFIYIFCKNKVLFFLLDYKAKILSLKHVLALSQPTLPLFIPSARCGECIELCKLQGTEKSVKNKN